MCVCVYRKYYYMYMYVYIYVYVVNQPITNQLSLSLLYDSALILIFPIKKTLNFSINILTLNITYTMLLLIKKEK